MSTLALLLLVILGIALGALMPLYWLSKRRR